MERLRVRTGHAVDNRRSPENARSGVGGSYRVTDKLQLDAEVSDGDLGAGGRLGSNYVHSDHTSMYLNYALDNERTNNGLPSGRGSEGNLVAGVKSRLSRQHERVS